MSDKYSLKFSVEQFLSWKFSWMSKINSIAVIKITFVLQLVQKTHKGLNYN